jgi:hypothetical protein
MLLISKSPCRAPIIVLMVSAALVSCARRNAYAPPPGANVAIVGTKLDVSVPFVEDIRVMVSYVDGWSTGPRRGWETPTLVTPGSHLVQIVALHGQIKAEIATRVELEAGKTYQIRLSRTDEPPQPKIWLEDAQSGLPASRKIVAGAALIGLP